MALFRQSFAGILSGILLTAGCKSPAQNSATKDSELSSSASAYVPLNDDDSMFVMNLIRRAGIAAMNPPADVQAGSFVLKGRLYFTAGPALPEPVAGITGKKADGSQAHYSPDTRENLLRISRILNKANSQVTEPPPGTSTGSASRSAAVSCTTGPAVPQPLCTLDTSRG